MDIEPLPHGSAPLGLLSGDEFSPNARAFDQALLAAAGGTRVGLVLCADHDAAHRSAGVARSHFAAFGVTPNVCEHGKGFEDVDILYLAGGSPVDLTGCTHLRDRWPQIEQRWREGSLTIAGSSAGAMAVCTYTLVPTPGATAPTRWTTEGFGPLSRTALAVHASSRSDEWLSLVAASKPEGITLIALDDDAGLLLRAGTAPETLGTGNVRVLR